MLLYLIYRVQWVIIDASLFVAQSRRFGDNAPCNRR